MKFSSFSKKHDAYEIYAAIKLTNIHIHHQFSVQKKLHHQYINFFITQSLAITNNRILTIIIIGYPALPYFSRTIGGFPISGVIEMVRPFKKC